MKKLTLFLLTLIISCSAWGALAIPEGTVFYLKPNSNWKANNARFAVYFFGNGEKWLSMTQISDEWYAVKAPSGGYTKLIFCRMNPSTTTNNWTNRWNQTSDIIYNGNNICTINEGVWDKSQNYSKKVTDYYIAGTFTNNWGHVKMTNGSISYTLNAGDHEFKITDGSWDFDAGHHSVEVGDFKSINTYGNIKISLTEKSNITISFDGIKTTINYTDLTIDNQTNLDCAKYGKLSYQLEMLEDRWYWIVLPYNVTVSEIKTSTNGGWNDLVFTEYNAQRRAVSGNGWINWKREYTDKKQPVPTQLQANKGYVIGPKTTEENEGDKFPGMIVTFPSNSETNTVAGKIDLTATNTGGTTINDNWNIIGTGLYHNASLEGINYVALPARVNGNKDSYEYKYITSSKEPFFTEKIETNSFAPFEAFFVQYGGTYKATAPNVQSAALAPVARAKAQEQEQIYLINMNEARTVVILNAEGSEGYTAGEDFLEMNLGSRIEMIYSFDGTDALAFNHRATEAQSINLGGYVATAGEQTISLNAYNGNAEAVTLIDNLTGTTTDLLADNYTFTAEVGSLDGRFTIVFAAQKAGDTTVDCYNSVANQVIAYGTADHCTVSGLTAGKAIAIYNTMGQLVFCTVADSETITLPSLTAGNYLILHNGTTNKVALR